MQAVVAPANCREFQTRAAVSHCQRSTNQGCNEFNCSSFEFPASNMSTLKLEDFPNEVILTIFSFLDVKDLIPCAQVSKRVRAICHDDSLWKNINLYFKTVPADLIDYILVYGSCKYLSLWSADLIGNMNLNRKFSLKYLDLNFCKANDGVLNNLISACDSLEKLSLRNLTLNGKMIKAIGYVCTNLSKTKTYKFSFFSAYYKK